VLALSVGYGLFFGNVVLLPLWLQQWMGYTPPGPGMAWRRWGCWRSCMSPWVGRNVGRMDPRKLVTFAFLGFAFVMWLRSRFDTQVPFEVVVLPIVLQGAVMPFFFIPLQSILFRGLTPEADAGGVRAVELCAHLRRGIGTSIFTTLWERRAALHHAQLVEGVHSGNPALAVTNERLAAAGLVARAGGRHHRPADRPAGLHDGGDRHLPAVVGGVHRAGRTGVADAPAAPRGPPPAPRSRSPPPTERGRQTPGAGGTIAFALPAGPHHAVHAVDRRTPGPARRTRRRGRAGGLPAHAGLHRAAAAARAC
jgi:hypothetical protein